MVPISGIGLIRHLRRMGFEGKIIVMSAFFTEFEKDLRDLNVSARLDKPFNLRSLLDLING
jgi:DNA-binding response OmpR family regulator